MCIIRYDRSINGCVNGYIEMLRCLVAKVGRIGRVDVGDRRARSVGGVYAQETEIGREKRTIRAGISWGYICKESREEKRSEVRHETDTRLRIDAAESGDA